VNVPEILNALPRLSVLVVGDICLDRWCRYDPTLSEASRETGISRIAVVSSETTPGAAGTVASNLTALGVGCVSVVGAIGVDGHGFELIEALRLKGIDSSHLVRESTIPTFTYTKLLNLQTDEEDLPRVDYVLAQPLPASVESAVLASLAQLAPAADVILVSDQAETETGGVITEAVRRSLTQIAVKKPGKPIWVDSRKRGEHFRRVLVKMNEQEARECCERLGGGEYEMLRRHIDSKILIVTQGADGALICTRDSAVSVPARRVDNPVDICGAGDSFNAGGSVALAITGNAEIAAAFGNLVASITVRKRGTGTASPAELIAASSR
jgi:rfaE bifunctional protein kinase chain/domain